MSVSEANQLLHNFNWQNPSWDLFIFLVWAVASIFYAFATGRGRVVTLLFSIYISKLLVFEAPWMANALNSQLPGVLLSLQQLVSFLLIFIVVFILLSKYAFKSSIDGRRFGSFPFTLVFSFLQIGLLINTVLSFLAVSGKSFSPFITFIFVSEVASFLWIILPLVFLIIVGRAVTYHHEL